MYDSGAVLDNPDYWYNKEKGVKKLRHFVGVDNLCWREVGIKAY
jgi:hypothetical protein